MTIRCAVAASRGEALGSLRVAAARSMACTGSATWGFGGRIAHPEGLKEVGKGQSQVGAGAGASGVRVIFQHKGLCHVTQGLFNGLGSNLRTFPKESSTSPGGKAQE
jgi:hypothetical protein